jgi:hypothetical protein
MFKFDAIGDFNPQLLRELKSRWNLRNGAIAAVISLLAQAMVLMSMYSKLPDNGASGRSMTYPYNNYCMAVLKDRCTVDSLGNILINWSKWWAETATSLSWLMFYGLFAGGVYLLASSFSQEEKRGTLNFIRLTPQKASQIFVGKLLGVPILVYLGTALALPLQFHATHAAGISRLHLLSWDIFMVAVAAMLYLGAILATMWFKAQSILLAGVTLFASYPVLSLSMSWYQKPEYRYSYMQDSLSDKAMEWYGMSLGNNLPYYFVFAALTMGGVFWLYKALERRYLKPTSTVLSKGQSYLWSFLFHVFFAGFYVYHYTHRAKGIVNQLSFHPPFNFGNSNYYHNSFISSLLVLFATSWLLLLVPLLLPGRQSLVEWARHQKKSGNWLTSLLWNDKSPAVLAVGVNVAIAALVWIPLSASHLSSSNLFKMMLGAAITATLAMIYSAIAHWGLFWKVNNRHAWMAGIVGGLVFLPVIGATVISFNFSTSRNPLYLVSPFLWNSIKEVGGLTSLTVFALLVAVLAWLGLRLTRVLKKVGRSESFQHFGAQQSA